MGSVNAPATTTSVVYATISTADATITTRIYDADNTTSSKWCTNSTYPLECEKLEFLVFSPSEPS